MVTVFHLSFLSESDRLPYAFLDQYQVVASGARSIIVELIIIAGLVFIIAGVVLVTQAMRRIPVQYAKRVVGRKYTAVLRSIFRLELTRQVLCLLSSRSQLCLFLNTMFDLLPNSQFMQGISKYFDTSLVYAFLYGSLIVFFTYFYTAIAFNPKDVSDHN